MGILGYVNDISAGDAVGAAVQELVATALAIADFLMTLVALEYLVRAIAAADLSGDTAAGFHGRSGSPVQRQTSEVRFPLRVCSLNTQRSRRASR